MESYLGFVAGSLSMLKWHIMQKPGYMKVGPMGDDVKDGRMSVADLVRAYKSLGEGANPLFEVKKVIDQQLSEIEGPTTYPIVRIASAVRGPALWLLAGVHGEEPAGPNAIAQKLVVLNDLAWNNIPVVVYPLLNPAGYAHDWRYFDARRGSGTTVADPDHVLPVDKRGVKTFANEPASRYAEAIIGDMLDLCHSYPPRLVFDLHEDEDLGPEDHPDKNPYIYVHGEHAWHSPISREVCEILKREGAILRHEGKTRFGEEIRDGVVHGGHDRSVDDFLTRAEIIHTDESGHRKRVRGPNAELAVVVETRIDAIPLENRVHCHASILENLINLFTS